MIVYVVVSRDIDKKTRVMYSEGISVYHSERDAEQEARKLRDIFDEVEVYQSEVR